jgi:putative hydrolase of the HAD superfamily
VRFDDQTLVFDADDTLWENNHLFERVIDDYLAWLAHPTLTRAEIRAVLLDIEAANAATHGYGSEVFLRSLRDCFGHLQERPASAAERTAIERLAQPLLEHRVEPIDGVVETLGALGRRHQLLLLTKGATDEQQRKIDASGLANHFEHVDIVAEKNVETYRWLIEARRLDATVTWMIGNSPRSDIAPAREAGLGAVYIPNASTWALEHADVDADDPEILQLGSVAEMLDHF